MSYILDALKKSEKERRHGKVPDLLSLQDLPREGETKRPLWQYLIIAALILNAGVLIWWIASVPPDGKVAVNKVSAPGPYVLKTKPLPTEVVTDFPGPGGGGKAVPPSDDKPQDAANRVGEQPSSVQATATDRPAVSNPDIPAAKQQTGAGVALQTSPTALKQTAAVKPREAAETTPPPIVSVTAPTEPKKVAATAVPDPSRIYKLKELPAGVRTGLPEFSVTAFLYSDNPASRMVRINDQMMKEGQDLSPGLKLEEITSDGVILRYQGYRFHLAL